MRGEDDGVFPSAFINSVDLEEFSVRHVQLTVNLFLFFTCEFCFSFLFYSPIVLFQLSLNTFSPCYSFFEPLESKEKK